MKFGDNLKAMSDLDNYAVEKGDPDPRGWHVTSNDGQHLGKVRDLIVDTSIMKVRYLLVDLESSAMASGSNDRAVLLEVNDIDLRHSSRDVLVRRFAPVPFEAGTARSDASSEQEWTRSGDRDTRSITRSEEELEVGKRESTRGEARIGKHVETEHVREPVTLRREEAYVERRPVEAGARGDASITDEDEIRIPLKEEQPVVEKRPVVKEELVVGKRVVEDRDHVEADVRRERFDLEGDVRDVEHNRDRNRRDR